MGPSPSGGTLDIKITLDEKSIPGEWYNIVPDLPFDLPPATSPRTGYPIGPHDLDELFPPALIEQELALNAHGYFDFDACESYLASELEDADSPAGQIASALARLPNVEPRSQK